MAQAVKPAFAIGPIWCRQEYQDSGKPWTMITNGPEPSTTARRRMSGSWMVWKLGMGESPSGRQLERQNHRHGKQAGEVVPENLPRQLRLAFDRALSAAQRHGIAQGAQDGKRYGAHGQHE